MEQTAIEVKDLQVGDEVIVTGLRYLKILKLPQKRTKPIMWAGIVGFKSVKCQDLTGTKIYDYADRVIYYDFNYKAIWLVKRENNI